MNGTMSIHRSRWNSKPELTYMQSTEAEGRNVYIHTIWRKVKWFPRQKNIRNVAKDETWIHLNKRNRINQTYWQQNFVSLKLDTPFVCRNTPPKKNSLSVTQFEENPPRYFSQFWMEIIVMIDCFLGTPSNWNLKMWSSRPTSHPQKPIKHKPPASELWKNTLQSTSLKNPAKFLLHTRVFSCIRGPGRCCQNLHTN